jgi:hypothetical protein
MAYVIYSLNVCINGSCDPADTIADEEHHEYAIKLLSRCKALLLGRKTFDMFLVLHRFVWNRFTSMPAVERGSNEQITKPVVMVTKAIEILKR